MSWNIDTRSLPTLQRLLRHVVLDDSTGTLTGCWTWNGVRDKQGYGRMWISKADRLNWSHVAGPRRRKARAHRVAYELLILPMALVTNAVLDHKCRNRACINPEHLEPLTSRQNTLRGVASRRAAGVLPLFKEDI